MPLDPDVEAFLELVELGKMTGKAVPMHQLSVEQARTEFEASAKLLDSGPPQDIDIRSYRVPLRDGESIEARLYRGAQSEKAECPIILYFHGGGYVVGSLNSHDCVCRRLALASGFVVLAPAYRLAPEYRFPTAVEDAEDTAAWLLEKAEQLGLDRERIIVAGDSAGATLAALLAIGSGREGEVRSTFRPAGQLLFYPVTNASSVYESFRNYGEGYLLESATMDWFYQQYLDSDDQKLDWRVSPLLEPTGECPVPAYIRVAEYDPLRDEGKAYADFLRGKGGCVDFELMTGLTHDFLRMAGVTDRVDAVYSDAAQWLKARWK
ncbi:alpha/beta hydrolase [Stutzerimonas kirkiae]|uniref:Alpha/beta hydrolase n=1 Tax=Stutzerimonas kirkiae TaxID=2211392 RepID=A0A4Q9QXE8_9GAMM|nr:alpha/beta hydrolase [Stutzerimonas kirkiae]TBU88041.1 alpha/beta hydrolase [Stutzerimonas kirkiae]TBU98198.1 alpha/beta hydrolase [Stutzerimonas kirkiae]